MSHESVTAWQAASNELAVSVTAPYLLVDDRSGDLFECIAWVPWFGSLGGTVILGRLSPSPAAVALCERLGVAVSLIDERAYSAFSRDLFVDTFNDWGWFGAADAAPAWYTGESWTESS